jgi:hypothetical protein
MALPSSPVSAVDVPTEALDFAISITAPPAKPGNSSVSPSCNPVTQRGKGKAKVGVTATSPVCNITRVTPSQVWTGTAVSEKLVALDPGFGEGTLTARCNSQRKLSANLKISQPVTNPEPTVVSACRFTLAFQDTEASTLSGMIDVDMTAANINGDATNSTKRVTFSAQAKITTGSGAFTGYVGIGIFAPLQTLDIDAGSGGHGVRAARMRAVVVRTIMTSNQLSLTLEKKPDEVSIIAPVTTDGKLKSRALVQGNTKIQIAATPNATCTVTTNTGKVVGTGVVGITGFVTIQPRSNAYKGARSVRVACSLGESKFTSNFLKIALK